MPRAALRAPGLIALTVLIGCGPTVPSGPPKVPVTGRLLEKGAPLTVDPAMAAVKAARIELEFGATTSDARVAGESFPAVVADDGSFTVPGGAPVGKYRVSVRNIGKGGDAYKGGFSGTSSPITAEVDGKTPIEIDLSKHKPGRQQAGGGGMPGIPSASGGGAGPPGGGGGAMPGGK